MREAQAEPQSNDHKAMTTKPNLEQAYETLANHLRPILEEDSGLHLLVTEPGCFATYFHKNDWTTDPAEAIAIAEKKRQAKIASVKKQLVKLEAMTFPDAEELDEMSSEEIKAAGKNANP